MTSKEEFEECQHMHVTYGDDDERGVCDWCGATCDWHYEKSFCSVEDHNWWEEDRVPDKWYPPEDKKKNAGSV